MYTEKEAAVLVGTSILYSILADTRQWVCRRCEAKTTALNEVCSGCGVEDLTQGESHGRGM